MDTKSSSILGICIIIAAALVALVLKPSPNLSAPQIGRYQMSGVPGHAYVIDSTTGQVWEDFASSGSGSSDADFKKTKVK